MNSIILMGIKHCGKSTQGKRIAGELGLIFFDTDDLITQENGGKSPREIYSEGGEEAFILAEKKACENLVSKLISENKDAVIATGGGICKNAEALETLHKIGKFVFLQADESIAADRIVREAKTDEDGEPVNLPAYIAKKNPHSILEVRKIFHGFYTERVKIYSELADITVQMGNDSKAENTRKILEAVEK